VPYVEESGYAQRYTQRELDQLKATGTAAGGVALSFDRAVADASELVDSYLAAIPGRAFALPLTVPPAKIVGITADLARFELWAQRASEEVVRRRDQAMEYLKDLVAGRAVLQIADEVDPPDVPSPVGRVGYRAAGRVFTDDSLAGFIGCGAMTSEDWRP
jgi:phage gp36-like protein